LRRSEAGFPGLARIVVGQQLSVASAGAIWGRFTQAFPELTPDKVYRAREPRFRRAGMSAPKIRTLRAVAAACRNGLDLDGLADMAAEDAHARLVAVHGIGPWTADIYLMFCLGHPGRLSGRRPRAPRRGCRSVRLESPADPEELATIAEKWSPWRSVAATLFWAWYGARKQRKAVPV
jgi:DNA-3-methyladenine glycosylase II